MPPVTLLSPYSGRPVVVREQDLGRAIRDEQGRVFYVVEDPEHGRYASMTRKGSDKDLERYRELQTAPPVNGEASADPGVGTGTPDTPGLQPHDATGTQRRNPLGLIAAVVFVLLVIAGMYVIVAHPEWIGLDGTTSDPPADEQKQDEAPTNDQGSDQPRSNHPTRTIFVNSAEDEQSSARDTDAEQNPIETPQHTDGTTPPGDTQHDPPAETGPLVSDSPAVLPDSPEAYADRLSETGDTAVPPADDPTPVIVPTRTWRPEEQPRVLSETGPATRPYADYNHAASGLRYKLTHKTDGPPAKAGSYLEVRYTAQTLDGESLIDDASQTFVLMAGQAIRAFDEGLAGIREGEQISLLVPRGHSEDGTLPGIERVPDKPFLLDVQLVSVQPGVTHVVEKPGDAEAEPAMPGDTVSIHYLVKIEGRDEVIDATTHRGEPMGLTLGKHEVIPGLELGVAGMRPGEIRLLTIPPYLAYGETGTAGGLIPPDAVLSFRVTLVGIDRPDKEAASE